MCEGDGNSTVIPTSVSEGMDVRRALLGVSPWPCSLERGSCVAGTGGSVLGGEDRSTLGPASGIGSLLAESQGGKEVSEEV